MPALLMDADRAETAAFAATLLCVWITVFCAFRIPEKSPRLFLAVALFGLNWGVLLLYYIPGPPQNEILAGISGFLLLYVGVLLLREAAEQRFGFETGRVGWPDKLPLYVFRPTVGGFGVYLIARRILHVEWGWGTLALSLWGTLLTVLGYFAIWAGLTAMHSGARPARRAAWALGVLLAVYAGWEVSYSVWYARSYWPLYHRFLAVQSQQQLPNLDRPLPFDPSPTWPDQSTWNALRSRPDWPSVRPLFGLRIEPRLPEMPVWLKHGFSILKLAFTIAFFWLIWRRPSGKVGKKDRGEWPVRYLGWSHSGGSEPDSPS